MNAAQLLAQYERIAEAPDAIARLRRFVLDLAVRGKLVPQDAGDEPAVVLLGRLRKAQAAALVRERLRSRPPVARVARDDLWFTMPESWQCPSLDDLFVIVSGVTLGQRVTASDTVEVPYLRVANVQRGFLDLTVIKTLAMRSSDLDRYTLRYGDLLMTEGGDWDKLGRTAVWRQELTSCVHQNHVFRVRPPSDEISPEWVALYANSPSGQQYFANAAKQTTNLASINLTQLRGCPLPLPPLAEQHRIVAKVDELMALCDRLEAARTAREATRDRLAAASLARLNTPDPETFPSDARFALNALPALTARPDQIKQLRQTILNLAVRGKLVPQVATEEPVADLLARIEADKAQREGGRSKGRSGAPRLLPAGEAPYEVPPSWAWSRFGDITVCRDGERVPVSKEERSTRAKTYDYYGASGVIDQIDGYLFDKPLLLIGEDGANLINRSTPIAFMARGRYWVNNHAHVIDAVADPFLRYIELYINAIDLKPYVTGTAQPKMNQAKMNSIPVALPPEPEQRRILAKVDALMVLCDALEASLTATSASRRRLLDALLAEALAPVDVAEMETVE